MEYIIFTGSNFKEVRKFLGTPWKTKIIKVGQNGSDTLYAAHKIPYDPNNVGLMFSKGDHLIRLSTEIVWRTCAKGFAFALEAEEVKKVKELESFRIQRAPVNGYGEIQYTGSNMQEVYCFLRDSGLAVKSCQTAQPGNRLTFEGLDLVVYPGAVVRYERGSNLIRAEQKQGSNLLTQSSVIPQSILIPAVRKEHPTTGLSFRKALKSVLKDGKSIRRASWHEDYSYGFVYNSLVIQEGSSVSSLTILKKDVNAKDWIII